MLENYRPAMMLSQRLKLCCEVLSGLISESLSLSLLLFKNLSISLIFVLLASLVVAYACAGRLYYYLLGYVGNRPSKR